MIGCSKKNEVNYPGNYFWTREKETRGKNFVKIFPRFLLFCLFCLNFLFQNNLNGYLGLQPLGKYQFSLSSSYFFVRRDVYSKHHVICGWNPWADTARYVISHEKYQICQDEAVLGRLMFFSLNLLPLSALFFPLSSSFLKLSIILCKKLSDFI